MGNNELIGMDNVYFEIHKRGKGRMAIIPSTLMTKDLLDNSIKADEMMNELKSLIAKDPAIPKETKRRLISDIYKIQKLTKFWRDYEK